MNERSIFFFFTFSLEQVREREGGEWINLRADERRHEKVARTYQPNIVGLIWRCAGVGQHWPPHWSGDALSDHPDQHRGYRGSRGPASFSRSRFRHLSRGLRGGSSWHWKPTRPIGPGSGIYISSLAYYRLTCVILCLVYIRNWKAIEIIELSHKNREHQLFFNPSSKLCSNLRSFVLSPSPSPSTFSMLFLSRSPGLKNNSIFSPWISQHYPISLFSKKIMFVLLAPVESYGTATRHGVEGKDGKY